MVSLNSYWCQPCTDWLIYNWSLFMHDRILNIFFFQCTLHFCDIGESSKHSSCRETSWHERKSPGLYFLDPHTSHGFAYVGTYFFNWAIHRVWCKKLTKEMSTSKATAKRELATLRAESAKPDCSIVHQWSETIKKKSETKRMTGKWGSGATYSGGWQEGGKRNKSGKRKARIHFLFCRKCKTDGNVCVNKENVLLLPTYDILLLVHFTLVHLWMVY